MDIGQLNQRADVLRLVGTEDDWGQQVPTWATFISRMHVRIKHPSSSAERELAGAVRATTRAEFRSRYRTDITASMRFLHKGRTYNIVGVRPNELNREWTDYDAELIE